MGKYRLKYVHKIAPSEKDVAFGELPDTAFADRKTLARELRQAGLLTLGARITEMRTEGEKVVIFPSVPGLTTYWHSVTITPES